MTNLVVQGSTSTLVDQIVRAVAVSLRGGWIYNSRYRVYTATYSIQTLINNKTPLAIIDLSGTSRYSLTHSGNA